MKRKKSLGKLRVTRWEFKVEAIGVATLTCHPCVLPIRGPTATEKIERKKN